ncbi:hypothetical protein BKA62DRAFT_675323, partial [Auriculariales sp. MPI-PUGE-AT-0066]
RCKAQIADEEQKRKAKPGRKARILDDGLPHLLTGDEFVARVVAAVRAEEEKREQLERRTAASDRWKAACAEWDVISAPIKARNDAKQATYNAAKIAYAEEREAATRECRKRQMKEPRRGPMEKIPNRPKLKDFIDAEDDAAEDFSPNLESLESDLSENGESDERIIKNGKRNVLF